MVCDQFAESVVSLLIVQRVDERLVWGEQIERSYDRNQPFRVIPDLNPNEFQSCTTEAQNTRLPPCGPTTSPGLADRVSLCRPPFAAATQGGAPGPVFVQWFRRTRSRRPRAGPEKGCPVRQPCPRAGHQRRHANKPSKADSSPHAGMNRIPHPRVNLLVPLASAEHPVVPDTGLHMVVLQVGPDAAAQVLRGHGLAD